MCLESLETYPNVPEEGYGWKTFVLEKDDTLSAPFFPKCRFPPDQWKQDDCEENRWTDVGYKCYPSGFHLFLRKEDADRFASTMHQSLVTSVRKVQYRTVVASGPQFIGWGYGRGRCVVAREIRVLPEETHHVPENF